MRLFCWDCRKPVSTALPMGTIFRATATCPECEESKSKEIARLRSALEKIGRNRTEDCEIYTMGCDCHEVALAAVKGETI
jgi:hypothetical protein